MHNFTNVSNDEATLILVGRLFQTTTPEYEKLPLYKLHFACGNRYVLCATDRKLDLCCQGLYLSFQSIHVNKLVLN